MKLEQALKQLRKGAAVRLRGVQVDPRSEVAMSLFAEDLLSEDWEAELTDDQIIKIWEDDVKLRESTRQPAQAALLKDCIKLLRTRQI